MQVMACDGTYQYNAEIGQTVCSGGMVAVDLPGDTLEYTVSQADAMEIGAAIAVIFAIAWGLRLVVRHVLGLR